MNLFDENIPEPINDLESQLNEHSGLRADPQLASNDAVHESAHFHSLSEGGKRSVWFSTELSGRRDKGPNKKSTVALGNRLFHKLKKDRETLGERVELELTEEICRLAARKGVVGGQEAKRTDLVEQLQMLNRWARGK